MSTADALPDLTDEGELDYETRRKSLTNPDINVLDQICKHAEAASFYGPIKALTQSQDALFGTRARGSRHYGVLMRWIIRIGEAVTVVRRSGGETTLIHELRHLLEEHGITVIDDDEVEVQPQTPQKEDVSNRRRVSFDDARYEETWLSTHSQSLDVAAENPGPDSPMIESDNETHHSRAKSTSQAFSNTRYAGSTPFKAPPSVLQKPARKLEDVQVSASPWQKPVQRSEAEEDHIVAAFAETRLAKMYRFCFHQLCYTFLDTNSEQNWIRAVQHDRQMLARQSLSQWNAAAQLQLQLKQAEEKDAEVDKRYANLDLPDLKYLVFSQWRNSAQHRQRAIENAKNQLLCFRYFYRWRQITEEALARRQHVLTIVYFRKWLQETQEAQILSQQVQSQHEVRVKKKYFKTWLLQTKARKYERERLLKQSLQSWTCKSLRHAVAMKSAFEHSTHQLVRKTSQRMRDCVIRLNEASVAAQLVCNRRNKSVLITVCRKYAELKPREHAFRKALDQDTRQMTLKLWHTSAVQHQKARLMHESRLCEQILRDWNLAARTEILRRQYDSRIASTAISKLAIAVRLISAERRQDERVLRKTLHLMQDKLQQRNQIFDQKRQAFEAASWRITVSGCVQRLHRDLGIAEDLDRSAVEIHNMRVLPKTLRQWMAATKHVHQMKKWSEDAAFYVDAKKSLKAWQGKTNVSQQEKRRKAHDHIRARIKERIARSIIRSWHSQTMHIFMLNNMTVQHQFVQQQNQAFNAIQVWRIRRQEYAAREQYSQEQDQYKLVGNVIEAMQAAQQQTSSLDNYAIAFELETRQSRAVPLLRKLRFTAFSSVRLEETANLLQSRLRDRHSLLMIRQWAAATAEKRSKTQEPDSPSLRPASRAASRLSNVDYTSPLKFGQSTSATPAYLRTPSSRKRFRALPTIAPYTPFISTFSTATPIRPAIDAIRESTTPQVTPFRRKLRAGGIERDGKQDTELRSSVFGRSIGPIPPTTGKSVRFTSGGRTGK